MVNYVAGTDIFKIAVLRPATLLKTRLQYRCFPVKLSTFLRTRTIFTEQLWWLAVSGNWYTWWHKILWEKCGFTGIGRGHTRTDCFSWPFEKLKYYARFKVVEVSTLTQPRLHSNFKFIVKRYGGRGWHWRTIKSTFDTNPISDLW